MTVTPDDESALGKDPSAPYEQEDDSSGGIWEWIREFVADFVGEGIVQILSCVFLFAAGAGLFRGRQHSPVLTVGRWLCCSSVPLPLSRSGSTPDRCAPAGRAAA